jgi:hypothetical protein
MTREERHVISLQKKHDLAIARAARKAVRDAKKAAKAQAQLIVKARVLATLKRDWPDEDFEGMDSLVNRKAA